MRVGTLVFFAGLVAAPTMVGAETANRGDLAYCRTLSDIYVRYIGWDELYSDRAIRTRANNDAQVAVTKCERGDAAGAIPVLERELRNNKITLPARS